MSALSSARPTAYEQLAARCATCREVVGAEAPTINHGDLLFHLACGPTCGICQRRLEPGEAGWRSEGRVDSVPWGYAVRPTAFWCPSCLGNVSRDTPRAHF